MGVPAVEQEASRPKDKASIKGFFMVGSSVIRLIKKPRGKIAIRIRTQCARNPPSSMGVMDEKNRSDGIQRGPWRRQRKAAYLKETSPSRLLRRF